MFAPISHAQQQAAFSGMDIIFAVDMSGSMTHPVHGNGIGVDRGANSQTVNFPPTATDPDNLAFDTVRFMLDWLVDFAQSQAAAGRSVDIRVRVLGFNQSVVPVIDSWVAVEERNRTQLLFTTPRPSDGESDSDFIDLYSAVRNDFNDSNGRQQLFFMITDSTPCDPNGPRMLVQGNFSTIFYNDTCTNTNPDHVLSRHIEYANNLLASQVEQYIYHVSDSQYWARTPEVLNDWQDDLSRSEDGFRQVAQIDDVPGELFQDLLTAVTLLVQDNPDPAGIGIFAESGGAFNVPPYQTEMDVITFLKSGDSAPTFRAQNRSNISGIPLYSSETRQMLRLQFSRPDAGSWTGSLNRPLWASYRPAKAAAELERVPPAPDTGWTPHQYDSVRLVYKIVDEDNTPLLDRNYLPNFDAVIRVPGNDEIPLTLSPDGSIFASEPFFLQDSGSYSFRLGVEPQEAWLSSFPAAEATPETPPTNSSALATNGSGFNFLQPPTVPSFRAEPVTFVGTFGSADEQAALNRGDMIRILRSERVPVSIEARAGGQKTPLPASAEAHLVLDGDGCLETSLPLVRAEDGFTVRGGLEFNTGRCKVSGVVSIATDITRVSSQPIPDIPVELGEVEVNTTARLSLALLNSESQAILQNFSPAAVINGQTSTLIHYRMQDVIAWPPQVTTSGGLGGLLSWQHESLNIELLFTDEAGNPINPGFANFQQSSAAAPAGAAAQDNTGIDQDFPVPFNLRITRIGGKDDESEHLKIVPVKSSRVGYYITTISGLSQGDYEIRFELLRDDPRFALDLHYEYVASLSSTESMNNPQFVAFLHVSHNILVDIEVYGFAALVVLLIVLFIATIVRWRQRVAAPLNGSLAIYHFPPSTTEPELIWTMKAVPTNQRRNTFVYKRSQLRNARTMDIPLIGLMVTTNRQQELARNSGAIVEITVGGGRLLRYELRRDQPVRFENDYAIVKYAEADPPDTSSSAIFQGV